LFDFLVVFAGAGNAAPAPASVAIDPCIILRREKFMNITSTIASGYPRNGFREEPTQKC
jgi:hypothetical protein